MALDAVGIVTQDMAKSIDFYQHLGVHFAQLGGPDHYEATTDSGVRLMLDTAELAKKLQPNWQPNIGNTMVLCFKQDNATAVDQIYQAIISAGFESVTEPWDAFWGQRYASVSDPDGHQVDIFAAL